VKVVFYILVLSSAIITVSCNNGSDAQISGPVYKIPSDHPVGKDIRYDISRIRNLYTNFNTIANRVILKNKIAPTEVMQLNKIIEKLKCFEVVYSQKFFEKEIQQTAYAVLMNDPESNRIISEYIYLSRQLQDIEGRQFLNL
jgi:hypothetical protein